MKKNTVKEKKHEKSPSKKKHVKFQKERKRNTGNLPDILPCLRKWLEEDGEFQESMEKQRFPESHPKGRSSSREKDELAIYITFWYL